MDNIIEPSEDFQFSKLSLTIPSGIQGGAYFTKIQFNNKPLYIQTTKSLTRQGIVKTGKKYYCDLMFDKNSETLIQWFENLEETCQKLIYSKSDSWFQTNLEMNDIETAFNSPIRVYKSGKFYLLRVNIKTNHTTGDPTVKIYDENEIPLGIQDIQPETNIISILEIQGIKFTNRNFQVEIELKQMMVLNEPIFDNCLIKKNKNIVTNSKNDEKELNQTLQKEPFPSAKNVPEKENILDELETFDPSTLIIETNTLGEDEKKKMEDEKLKDEKEEDEKKKEREQKHLVIDPLKNENENDFNSVNSEENELLINRNLIENNQDDLKEFTIQVETTLDPITLKKPNEVYYQLYKEARKKAKEAKKIAIISYLEAKNIKKTYMLENMDESDDEFDAEMEDLDENDLYIEND